MAAASASRTAHHQNTPRAFAHQARQVRYPEQVRNGNPVRNDDLDSDWIKRGRAIHYREDPRCPPSPPPAPVAPALKELHRIVKHGSTRLVAHRVTLSVHGTSIGINRCNSDNDEDENGNIDPETLWAKLIPRRIFSSRPHYPRVSDPRNVVPSSNYAAVFPHGHKAYLRRNLQFSRYSCII